MEEKKLNLKEFNIKAAKAGKPVCTRDGRKVRILCYDLKGAKYPIVAAIETGINIYETEEIAKSSANSNSINYLSTIKIEWKE